MECSSNVKLYFLLLTVVSSFPVSWLCWSVWIKRDASLWRSLKSIKSKLICLFVYIHLLMSVKWSHFYPVHYVQII